MGDVINQIAVSSIEGLVAHYRWHSYECSIRVDPTCIIMYGSGHVFMTVCVNSTFLGRRLLVLIFIMAKINNNIIQVICLQSLSVIVTFAVRGSIM